MASFPNAIPRTISGKAGDYVSFLDFAAPADGVTDQSALISTAIASVVSQGRGGLYLPGGNIYTVSNPVALAASGIRLFGDPGQTIIQATAAMPTGKGVVDIAAGVGNIQMENIQIVGRVTSPTGLLYSTIAGNPLYSGLVADTSIWIHGGSGSGNHRFRGVKVSHSGGYSIQIDATTGEIFYVLIDDCDFEDSRPTLQGTSSGDLNYGGWNSGVFAHGDGTSKMVHDLHVNNCRFKRLSGNAFWTWAPATSYLHTNVNVTDCYFEDCGLDGTQFGAVDGGGVRGCGFRRIGFVSLTDGAVGAPKWLADANAVAIDTSGLVLNCNYENNWGISVNGEAVDIDGLGASSVKDNTFRRPAPGSPEFTIDQISTSGPGGTGLNWFEAISGDNTNNTLQGGSFNHITGNVFINYGSGINLFAARFNVVTNNYLSMTVAPESNPFQLGNIGSGTNQIATGNIITKNVVIWNPGGPAPVVFENANTVPLGGPLAADYWTSADANFVYENDFPLSQVAFQKDPNTSSDTYSTFHSNSVTAVQLPVWFQQVAFGVGNSDATLVWYANVLSAGKVKLMDLQFQSGAPVLSLYPAAGNLFGGFNTTTSRAFNSFSAPVGGVYGAGGVTTDEAMYMKALSSAPNAPGATPGSGGLPPGTGYGALAHKVGSIYWYYNSTSSAWATVDFSTSGSTPPGLDTELILNQGGASYGASAGLAYTYGATNPCLTVYGSVGFAAIATGRGYIQSLEGFLVADAGGGTPSQSYQCVHIANGGIWSGASVYANNYTWLGRSSGSPGSGGIAARITPGDALGDGMVYYDIASNTFQGHQGGAWVTFSTGGSGAAAGTTNDVQVNNGGSFSAASGGNFTFNLTTGVLNIGGTSGWAQTSGGYVSTANSWQALNMAGSGGGSYVAGEIIKAFGSTGAYLDINAMGYGSYPVPLSGLSSFGATDVLLWVSTLNDTGISGNPGPVTSVGLNTNSYVNAAAGFVTANTAFNAIQAPGGGIASLGATIGGPNGQKPITITLVGTSGAGSSGSQRAGLAFADHTGAQIWQMGSDTTALGDSEWFLYCANATVYSIRANDATANIGLQGAGSATTGQVLTVYGISGQAAVTAVGGFMQSDQGYFTASTAVTAINVPSGGAQFGKDVQMRTLYVQGQTSAPASPTAGFGGLSWKSGSTYWYWNGTSMGQVNLAATSAVISVSGSGSGISVSPTTGAVVVTNTGVTSLTGTANEISVSGGTGSVTLSFPAGGIDVAAIAVTDAVFNSIQSVGSIAVRTSGANLNDLTSNGAVVINNSHVFVGQGVNTPSYGVAAASFNPFVGGTQYTGAAGPFTLFWSGGFTIGGSTFHSIEIAGGVVVGIS